ncbi:MerR family transcriptional regulator [Sphaerotilus microaerophilus]|uniref:Cobalamin-binding protein n=1 Tax=Sphaerotilus microaerophilus TaxID=2914710 RepID=A0ABM7YIT6_9BURK|nr:MerR family transcriptional regulator [Sphaerotilus sp. FB-5]BDI04168.1 hypothetical protein CATMQ487_11380 [Sphaerotilus sp. FB-5]
MNTTAPTTPPDWTIAAVERDTRIGKDTLRVWERRYGFPQPVRDANGERLYPLDQVERLRHIKRLLDAGLRPGRVVAMPLDELLRHAGGLPPATSASPPLSPASATLANKALDRALPAAAAATIDGEARRLPSNDVAALMQLLRAHELHGLRRSLSQALLRRGLARFITEMAIPLLAEVGTAWSRGQLQIYEEHLCSEVLETVLRAALAAAPAPDPLGRPRVVLATFPGEHHGLGLLMADALFGVEGCCCLNLGRQTPMRELLLAAQAHRAQVVALSFSSANNPNQVLDSLQELRRQTDPAIEIWAGVPFAPLLRRGCDGVQLLSRLDDIPAAVQRWHSERGDPLATSASNTGRP